MVRIHASTTSRPQPFVLPANASSKPLWRSLRWHSTRWFERVTSTKEPTKGTKVFSNVPKRGHIYIYIYAFLTCHHRPICSEVLLHSPALDRRQMHGACQESAYSLKQLGRFQVTRSTSVWPMEAFPITLMQYDASSVAERLRVDFDCFSFSRLKNVLSHSAFHVDEMGETWAKGILSDCRAKEGPFISGLLGIMTSHLK